MYVYSVTIFATVAYERTSSASRRHTDDLASRGRRRLSASSARVCAAVLASLAAVVTAVADAEADREDEGPALAASVTCEGALEMLTT